MFRPREMRKVELAVPVGSIVTVTEVLASSGVFHHIPTAGVTGGQRLPHGRDWAQQPAEFVALEQRVMAVMSVLNVDEGPVPSDTLHLIEPEVAQLDVEHLESETQVYVEDLEAEEQKLVQLERYVDQLQLVADLPIELDALRGLRYAVVLVGTIPVVNLDRLESSLEHIPSALVTLRRGQHLATVVLMGARRDAEIIDRAARSAYLNPLAIPEAYRGTPAEVTLALQAGIARTQQRIAEYHEAIERLHLVRVRHLRHLLWRVRASRGMAETISRYGRLRYTYLIEGWVPTSQVSDLKQSIEQISDKVLFETSQPWRHEVVRIPVAIDNPSPFKAFQSLVTNYGYPRYGELDPTFLLAMTFPLIFGMMFGDIGHGLMLAAIGVLLAGRRIRALRRLSGLGTVVALCGAAATVFGFLYGSLFGFEGVFRPLWAHPLENIMQTLLFAVGAGVVLLSVGMVANGVNAAMARQWGRMLFDHHGLAGLVFYWSVIGLSAGALLEGLPISPALFGSLAIVSGLTLAFSGVLERLVGGHRPLFEDSLIIQLVRAPMVLFETAIGLFSDTLSYVRIGAFAVAHGALSMVVFILADLVSQTGGTGYWIVVVLGNLFVVGFEGLIVGIQTLRLEYYEFFSKFFSARGERYTPLSLLPRRR